MIRKIKRLFKIKRGLGVGVGGWGEAKKKGGGGGDLKKKGGGVGVWGEQNV